MPNSIHSNSASVQPSLWYAVKVRARREGAIGHALRQKGYDVLLPTYLEKRRYSDRIRTLESALFPGYIFVCTNAQRMTPLIVTIGVSYVVRSGESVIPLSSEDQRKVELLCQPNALSITACTPHPYMRIGERVRIQDGPFDGLEGLLARVRNSERVIVTVESLHVSISIEVSHSSIVLLDRQHGSTTGHLLST
jgi:transcription antitermination factor NusG